MTAAGVRLIETCYLNMAFDICIIHIFMSDFVELLL